jgi:hypothetical protein
VRSLTALLIALSMAGTAASAQIAPADKRRADRVAALVEWVRGPQGRDNTLQIAVVRMLGLGNSDLPAKRKAYDDDKTHLFYAIYLVTSGGRDAVVLARKAPGGNIIWNIGPAGEIKNTIFVQQQGTKLNKGVYLEPLEETITFLESEKQKTQK